MGAKSEGPKEIKMIDKEALEAFITKSLEGTDLYLVEVTVSPSNEICVEVDSDSAVDIDECVELSRKIETEFDREAEDYELEVGSAGITSPFKVKRQYDKNIGKDVEVLSSDGKKYKGVLLSAGPESFTISSEEKVKEEGSKRPVLKTVERTFPYTGVKYTKYDLKF